MQSIQVIDTRNNKILFWLSFSMVFPAILVLGQNLSLFFMLAFFANLVKNKVKLKITKVVVYTFFIIVGAVISVVDVEPFAGSLNRALIVLPNYIYWCLIVILMSSHLHKVNMFVIYKGITYGIIASVVYFFLQDYLTFIPFFRTLYGNGYAFLIICFSPIALYYYFSKQKKAQGILLIITLIISMLIEGRRAGLLLASFEAFMVIFFLEIKARNIAISLIAALTIVVLMNTPFARVAIKSSNSRIYQIIYETEDIATEDQSYLIRLAMVNKGLQMFEDNPLTGVGLNNFIQYDVDNVELNFEGGETLKYKNLNNKSAHNSYISLLAEGGLLLFLPIILLLGTTIFYLIRNYNKIDNFKKPALWGLVGMCVHMYFISAIVNVFPWYLIGIAATFALKGKIYFYPVKKI